MPPANKANRCAVSGILGFVAQSQTAVQGGLGFSTFCRFSSVILWCGWSYGWLIISNNGGGNIWETRRLVLVITKRLSKSRLWGRTTELPSFDFLLFRCNKYLRFWTFTLRLVSGYSEQKAFIRKRCGCPSSGSTDPLECVQRARYSFLYPTPPRSSCFLPAWTVPTAVQCSHRSAYSFMTNSKWGPNSQSCWLDIHISGIYGCCIKLSKWVPSTTFAFKDGRKGAGENPSMWETMWLSRIFLFFRMIKEMNWIQGNAGWFFILDLHSWSKNGK